MLSISSPQITRNKGSGYSGHAHNCIQIPVSKSYLKMTTYGYRDHHTTLGQSSGLLVKCHDNLISVGLKRHCADV